MTSLLTYNAQTYQFNSAQTSAAFFQKQSLYVKSLNQTRQDCNDYSAFPLVVLTQHALLAAVFGLSCLSLLGADGGKGGFAGAGIYSDVRFSEVLVLLGFYGNLAIGAGAAFGVLFASLTGVVEVVGETSWVRVREMRLKGLPGGRGERGCGREFRGREQNGREGERERHDSTIWRRGGSGGSGSRIENKDVNGVDLHNEGIDSTDLPATELRNRALNHPTSRSAPGMESDVRNLARLPLLQNDTTISSGKMRSIPAPRTSKRPGERIGQGQQRQFNNNTNSTTTSSSLPPIDPSQPIGLLPPLDPSRFDRPVARALSHGGLHVCLRCLFLCLTLHATVNNREILFLILVWCLSALANGILLLFDLAAAELWRGDAGGNLDLEGNLDLDLEDAGGNLDLRRRGTNTGGTNNLVILSMATAPQSTETVTTTTTGRETAPESRESVTVSKRNTSTLRKPLYWILFLPCLVGTGLMQISALSQPIPSKDEVARAVGKRTHSVDIQDLDRRHSDRRHSDMDPPLPIGPTPLYPRYGLIFGWSLHIIGLISYVLYAVWGVWK